MKTMLINYAKFVPKHTVIANYALMQQILLKVNAYNVLTKCFYR